MSWPEFFAQWGLVGLGFVWGYWLARRKWKALLHRSLQQHTARASEQCDYLMALLAQARQPKITFLPQPKKDERFDWKAGTGVA